MRKTDAFAMEKPFRHEYCREYTVLSQEMFWQQTDSLAGSSYCAPADSGSVRWQPNCRSLWNDWAQKEKKGEDKLEKNSTPKPI